MASADWDQVAKRLDRRYGYPVMRRLTAADFPLGRYPPNKELPDGTYRYATGLVRHFVFERDAAQCQYCGSEVEWDEANFDHVEPRPVGRAAPENLVVACRQCNKLKASQIIPAQLRPDTTGDFAGWLRTQSGSADYMSDSDYVLRRFRTPWFRDDVDFDDGTELSSLVNVDIRRKWQQPAPGDIDDDPDWVDDYYSDEGEFSRK